MAPLNNEVSGALDWKRISSEEIADCKVFSVARHFCKRSRTNDVRTGNFYVLKPSDWVNIIPITAAGEVVLIKQYRHGIEKVTLEIPGGMVDPEDKSPSDAAKRELLEETGYQADELVLLGQNYPNPAIQSNVCYTYLAHNVRHVQTPMFDGNEEIEIKLTPLQDIPHLIAAGEINHALVIVAFHFLAMQQADGSK